MSLIFRAGTPLKAGPLNAVNNHTIHSVYGTGAFTSTSTSFATFSSGGSFSFEKLYTATALEVRLYVGCWCNGAAPISGEFGIRINSVDATLARIDHPDASSHRFGGGYGRVHGIPAGSYTVSVIGRRISGSGTLTVDSIDPVQCRIAEIQE